MTRLALPLLSALLLSTSGCSHDHDHGPDGHSHGAEHGAEGHDGGAHASDAEQTEAPATPPSEAAATTGEPSAAPGPSTALKLGAWDAAITPAADRLTLTVRDADGARVTPSGDAKVVLTGTGQEAQRVTLTPSGEGWSGPARAAGAPGYVAVVSVTLGGATESGRATWGEVPAPAPAHDHGGEGHDHGDGGHSHGDGGHTH